MIEPYQTSLRRFVQAIGPALHTLQADLLRDIKPRFLITAAAALLLSMAFTIIYVEQETPTWFWDYANYHEKFKELLGEASKGLLPFIGFISESVRHSQHNVTPLLPLLPARLLFGGSRVAYIVSLVIFYLLPAALITTLLARVAWGQLWQRTSTIAVAIYAFLYLPYWAPTLRGHPDIVCIPSLAIATILILRSEYLRHATTRRSLLIGLLLWSAFLLRRHTIFTIAAVILATAIFAVSTTLLGRDKQKTRDRPVKTLLNLACLILATVLPALLFQHDYIKEILDQSYASTFGAYRQSVESQLSEAYGFFGPVLLLNAVAGGLYSAVRRVGGVLFSLLVPLLTFLGFQQAQAPSDHHLLIFSLFLFTPSCLPFLLIGRIGGQAARKTLLALFMALPVFSFYHTFPLHGDPVASASTVLDTLIPARRYPPLRLESYEEVKRLTQDIKQIIKTTDHHAEFAILASSDQLNNHIVRALGRKTLRDNIMGVSDVDLRDAFQLKLLDADYIVACIDPAIHLGEENQRVITVPSLALAEPGNPLHDSYERLANKEYRLADGTKAYVYKRLRPRSESEVEWLHRAFRQYYPEWKRNKTHIGRPRGGY
jgi:hypothetical protein